MSERLSSGEPERSSLTPQVKEMQMRHFANRCKKELGITDLSLVNTEDMRHMGKMLAESYLMQPHLQWIFTDDEKGMTDMFDLAAYAAYFLNDDQETTPEFVAELTKNAVYAYRSHLAVPDAAPSAEDMQEAENRLIEAVSDRLEDPRNANFRAKYFQALSVFGKQHAASALDKAQEGFMAFHTHMSQMKTRIDVAIQSRGFRGLDPATSQRMLSSILMTLENRRQQHPEEVTDPADMPVFDPTQQVQSWMFRNLPKSQDPDKPKN